MARGTPAPCPRCPALIQPLAPGQLGGAVVQANTILISPNGAGHGWFVDSTPYQDEEFSGGAAYPGSPAFGREDLLTTVMHELGHLAGLPDNDGSGLMGELLPTRSRRADLLDAGRLLSPAGSVPLALWWAAAVRRHARRRPHTG